MHGLGVVFGGGIDCIEDLRVMMSVCVVVSSRRQVHRKEEAYQWCRASIDELMLSTSRHYHEVPSFDILVFTSNGGFADSRGEGQDLVDGVSLRGTAVSSETAGLRGLKAALGKQKTDLIPNVPTNRHGHEDEL